MTQLVAALAMTSCLGARATMSSVVVSAATRSAAVKASTIDVIGYASPAAGTSYSNEVISFFSGDSGAVRQAIIAAREVGRGLLGALGAYPGSVTTPYI